MMHKNFIRKAVALVALVSLESASVLGAIGPVNMGHLQQVQVRHMNNGMLRPKSLHLTRFSYTVPKTDVAVRGYQIGGPGNTQTFIQQNGKFRQVTGIGADGVPITQQRTWGQAMQHGMARHGKLMLGLGAGGTVLGLGLAANNRRDDQAERELVGLSDDIFGGGSPSALGPQSGVDPVTGLPSSFGGNTANPASSTPLATNQAVLAMSGPSVPGAFSQI